MLLGSSIGERMKPMGEVGCTLFHSPGLHSCGNLVSYLAVDGCTFINGGHHRPVSLTAQVALHLALVKNTL